MNDALAHSTFGIAEREACWYALQTKPRYEKLVATSLENRGYESYLPIYRCNRRRPDRYREVRLPLFPGYVFCLFDVTVRLPILTTPGVLHVVGLGRTPVPIEVSELDAIRRVTGSALGAEPWPHIEAGQEVYVRDGPLQGLWGILLAVKNRCRLIVSITLLRRAIAVEIERDWIIPAALCPRPRCQPADL